ncbi:MAG: hypothetical protein J6M53_07445 [Bacteroidaceae bacterium]|nr:hypothetical protein [Bacteroidaceae bacterium]
MTLHIFNPGHDEALAAGTPYYTYARAARRLADDLWQLPRLWADAGDAVAPYHRLEQFRDWDSVERIEPWGWDEALVWRLRRAGAPERLLPTAAGLARIRALSSRRTAVALLEKMERPDGCESRWCETERDVRRFLRSHYRTMLKAPWSCSGRGLTATGRTPTEAQWQRVRQTLARQGAIVAEPLLRRRQDFAMEFTALPDGTLRYDGLSLFHTDAAGRYVGNVVAADQLLDILAGGDALHAIRCQIETLLPPLLDGGYTGPVGVDMMRYRRRGQTHVHPCVEINLRRTMGHVARRLAPLLPTTAAPALFRLGPADAMPQGATPLLSPSPADSPSPTLTAWMEPMVV